MPLPENRHVTGSIPESMIRAQLDRVLASQTFSKSERLRRFLRFVVEQTLAGQAEAIKEQVLARELYGRGADFTAAEDAVVRVDARRLRDKLREYYTENVNEPVVIVIPRGAYIPYIQHNNRVTASDPLQVPPAAVPIETSTARRGAWMQPRLVMAIAGVAAAIGLAGWLVRPTQPLDPPTLLPLTAYPGNEMWPSLSPDGNFVVYACAGPDKPGLHDICVQEVGTAAVQRIVETPANENFPAWSPDGREIAFARARGGREPGIFIISRVGGPERRISDAGTIVAWTPDGKSLLFRDRLQSEPFGIFRMDLGSLQRRRLTRPDGGAGDWSFQVSPDGKTLAFVRYERPGVSDLYVMPMQGGEPRRLTDWNNNVAGPAWTPDGKELIYAANDRLWRISPGAAPPGRGSPISNIPMPAGHLSISRPGAGRRARLAFYTPLEQISLRRIDLNSATNGGTFQSVLPFAAANRRDAPGRFSPDGSRVAFTSTRASPDYELWVADSDGTNPRQLTSFGSNRGMLAHSWSPDGRRILLDTAVEGNNDLYSISSDGGKPIRLTSSPAIEGLADWSRDGQWIYYASIGPGTGFDVWRIPPEGCPTCHTAQRSTPEQITKDGGSEPQLSPDGRYVYYLTQPPIGAFAITARLMRVAARGGEATIIHDRVSPFYWCVSDEGIYFLRAEGQVHAIDLYRFADEKIVQVGVLPFRVTQLNGPGRFTVSRDGRWAMVNVTDRDEGDLMLLDNFR